MDNNAATLLAAAKELQSRRLSRKSLMAFVQKMNSLYITSQFSIDVCKALELFYADVVAGKRPVLIISAPPQHGKSELASRNFPAWLLGVNPSLRIGGLSYGKELSARVNTAIQRIMMSDEYLSVFPASTLNLERSVTKDSQPRRNKSEFEIAGQGGSYLAQGVGGPLTGMPLDIAIIDDPIKNAVESLSTVKKEGVWDWYNTVLKTRLSKNSGQIIMATRWATDDLSGRVIDACAKNGTPCTVLNFPAIDDEGNALVPELHPLDKLRETQSMMSSYFWNAMYQGSPVKSSGNMFKDEWLQYYTDPPTMEYRAIFADTAQKTKETNDYTVFQCWGYQNGRAYLLDQLRGRYEAPELLTMAKAFWSKHKAVFGNGHLRQFYVEDKVSGTGLLQQMHREGIPIKGIKRTTDKITRAYDAAPLVETGRVYLPEGASWLSDFVNELVSFPVGSNDDQVDPFMDALTTMLYYKSDTFSDEMCS